MPKPSRDPAPRLQRSDWLEAGLAALGRGGLEGVRIGSLCETLGVTTGSFYHHFEGRGEFLEAMIDYWCVAQVDAVIALVEEQAGSPIARALALERLSVELGIGPQDQAMRAWARHDARARAAVRKADRKVLQLTERLLGELGVPEAEVGLMARVLFFSAIGSYSAEHLLRPYRRDEISKTVLGWVARAASGNAARESARD